MKPTFKKGLYFIVNLDFHTNRRVTFSPIKIAQKVTKAGCCCLQMRFKTTPDAIALEVAKKLREVTAASSIPFIINDRADIAVLSGANGVHIGQENLKIEHIKKISSKLIIGLSIHNLWQLRKILKRTDKARADYISIGPVFETKTKGNPDPPTGTSLLAKAVRLCSTPIVAIGGINEKNCIQIKKTGVTTVACISSIYFSSSPEKVARKINERMKQPVS